MAKGYWIVHITVSDPENHPKYIAADAAAFEKFNANFLVRGGRYDAVEGPARERHVVIEFESFERVLACYRSEEYQAAKLWQAYADSELIIVEGR
jgi:uncharacterized protein (DUF1330 family)